MLKDLHLTVNYLPFITICKNVRERAFITGYDMGLYGSVGRVRGTRKLSNLRDTGNIKH